MLPFLLRTASSRAPALPSLATSLRCAVLASALFLVVSDGRAESRPYRAMDPDSVLAQALEELPGEPLSLADAVDRVRTRSPRLEQARSGWAAAKAVVKREKGSFDPELFATIEAADAETPTSSSFAGAPVLKEKSVTSAFGARALFPLGTSLTATVDASKNETNSIYQSLDPEYFSVGRLELRQPLLRGFGPGTRGQLSAAERREDAERLRFEQVERDVRADTESLYWELYAAERDFVVQQLIVDQASALLDQATVRADAGLIGPAQVANARVFLAQQRLGLLDQEEGLAATSDRLAELIGAPPGAGVRYHTTEAPDFSADGSILTRTLGTETLLARVREESRELQASRMELAALEETARSGNWNALPGLDLFGALGGNGLSGSGVLGGTGTRGPNALLGEAEGTVIDGGYGDALQQSLGRDYPTWAVGVEISFPIGLRTGRGERNRAGAEASRQRARIQEIERGIETDLRDAIRRYDNGAARLELAREGVDAANEQVRVGLIEFENGRSTAFELVRLAADLASAQQELSRALVRTATARTDLYRLLGPLDQSRSEAVGGNR